MTKGKDAKLVIILYGEEDRIKMPYTTDRKRRGKFKVDTMHKPATSRVVLCDTEVTSGVNYTPKLKIQT